MPVVGITGSCGKTTTKEMIAATLAPAFRVLKNRLNLNNLIGMPLTLLELEGTHEAAVVEMGMNAFGEINRLTRISCPTIGVLTNVHPAHTEGVGDIAGVARAKGELIKALNHGAALIYNADDPWVARLAQDFRGPKLSFGLNAAAHLRATDRQTRGRQGQTARLVACGPGLAPEPAGPGAAHALQRPGRHGRGPFPGDDPRRHRRRPGTVSPHPPALPGGNPGLRGEPDQ